MCEECGARSEGSCGPTQRAQTGGLNVKAYQPEQDTHSLLRNVLAIEQPECGTELTVVGCWLLADKKAVLVARPDASKTWTEPAWRRSKRSRLSFQQQRHQQQLGECHVSRLMRTASAYLHYMRP